MTSRALRSSGFAAQRPLLRMVLWFIGIFVVVVAALVAIWPYVAPAYAESVGAVVRPLFHLVESPDLTVVDVQGDVLAVFRITGESQITPFQYFERVFFALVIPLIALIAATPGLGIRRRIERLIGGLVLLWVFQIVYVVAKTHLDYALFAGRDYVVLKLALRVLLEASPILIWIGLTAGAWKRSIKKARSKGTENNESPAAEPVGAEG